MARYSIGIDLGTTHSAVSYFNLEDTKGRGGSQAMLPVAQLTSPGTVEPKPLLPSFLYLPAGSEFPEGSLALPWEGAPSSIVGEFARTHGAKVPARLVSSAKSWLCHVGIDRHAPTLPWGSPEDVPRISPVDVAASYLSHLRQAWNASMAVEDASKRFEVQDLVLTVPASFDAAARELTLEAAAKAGLKDVVLLEEPQAALYAWLESMGDGFRKAVQPGDVLLVVDVGGGTTDFSLIAVTEKDGNVELSRLAVGDHILLGGDNMDLALAVQLQAKLTAEGKKLDAVQFVALTHAARMAKERFFADASLTSSPIAVAGRGSSLMGSTLRTELLRSELESLLVEGFFPQVAVDEAPRTARRSGLAQRALPYAQDAAITRHLGAFLTRQAGALAEATGGSPGAFAAPTAVLFNGGVFKAGALAGRLVSVLDAWLEAAGKPAAKVLEGADLDLSVARGAAYYGWVRQGHGIRIRGGTARAYYVGVEVAMPAVPGMEPPVRALCVAPFGMEEGTQADVPPQEFGLVVGEPTRFRFFSSSVRRGDKVGEFLDDVDGNAELEETQPIETTLGESRGGGDFVPVNLQAAVTELGLLELRCLERGGEGRWKLELNVREGESAGT